MTGKTRQAGHVPQPTQEAAMEPRRDDGEDALKNMGDPTKFAAAMEPRRDDGEDGSQARASR